MPTPRYHGGAGLANVALTAPGSNGLNTQNASSVLGPEWATKLENCVLDDSGRLAARKGWAPLTTTAVSTADEPFHKLVTYRSSGGERLIGIVQTTGNTKTFKSTDGVTWTEITNWWATATGNPNSVFLVNFNDALFAFGGHGATGTKRPKYITAVADTAWTDVTDTNAPAFGGAAPVALGAFGRLYAKSQRSVLKYSALLDGTDWTTASDAGTLDVTNVWPDNDEITGLAAYNGFLFIFGQRNILIYTDDQTSAIGFDPLNARVYDVIPGVGCLSHNTIQHVEGDLWFVSSHGLMSMKRLLVQRSNPLDNLSKNIRDELLTAFIGESSDMSALYYERERLYILTFPGGTNTWVNTGDCFVFDTRRPLPDGSARCLGKWTSVAPVAMVAYDTDFDGTDDLVASLHNQDGKVFLYSGNADFGTNAYTMLYESGWMDFDQGMHVKIPKRINGRFYVADETTATAHNVTLKWAYDFNETFDTETKSLAAATAGIRTTKFAPNKSGEYMKVGISVGVDDFTFALQELEIFGKLGRLA